MTPNETAYSLADLCAKYEINDQALDSARLWAADVFHRSKHFPERSADRAHALNHSIRSLTERLATRGIPGPPIYQNRLLSEKASQALLDQPESAGRAGLVAFAKKCWFEHKEPVVILRDFVIPKMAMPDELIAHILRCPPVTILREEDPREPGMRKAGDPELRHQHITSVLVDVSPAAYFRHRKPKP